MPRKRDQSAIETEEFAQGNRIVVNSEKNSEKLGLKQLHNTVGRILTGIYICNGIQIWNKGSEESNNGTVEGRMKQSVENKFKAKLKQMKINKTPAKHRDIFRLVFLFLLFSPNCIVFSICNVFSNCIFSSSS